MQAPQKGWSYWGRDMSFVSFFQFVRCKWLMSKEGVRRVLEEQGNLLSPAIRKRFRTKIPPRKGVSSSYGSISQCLSTLTYKPQRFAGWREMEQLNLLSKVQKGSISVQNSEAWEPSSLQGQVTYVCLRLLEKEFLLCEEGRAEARLWCQRHLAGPKGSCHY